MESYARFDWPTANLELKQALRIEDTMDKKGIVLNMQGAIIKNIAASQAELDV